MNTSSLASNEKFYKRLIYAISVVVFLIIFLLSLLPKRPVIPVWATYLPMINAIINGTVTVLLLISLYYIRKRNIKMHKKINIVACALSTLFIFTYVTFHSFGVKTEYPDLPIRPLYCFILLTHIILAAVVLPLVLLSLYRGLTNQVSKHKMITRWSYPIWLYVTTTGVIVYLMISPYYKF